MGDYGSPRAPFNPLEKVRLAESVANALLLAEIEPLPPEPFVGAGIYAIYYAGDFPAYAPLAAANADGKWSWPIYIGQAQSEGGRKGLIDPSAVTGTRLRSRLVQHGKSIEQATNLRVEDFACRYLVVEDVWIDLGESLLISSFSPVWNQVVEGFGNHDPGKGRHKGARPVWDTLHPGRGWADRLGPSVVTLSEIEARIVEHLAGGPPAQTVAGRVVSVDTLAAE